MIKYTRTFIAILVAIATALTFAGCPTTTNNNEECEAAEFRAANPIVDGPVAVGDIDFELDAGINLTNAQIEAITATLSGLSAEQVAAFVDYVDGVTFAQNDLGATVGQGEDATATIRIAADVDVEEIMAALTAARTEVRDVRDAAREEREAEEELARQASVIAELSAEFAGYISNITFADVDAPGYELDENADPVTASVTLPNNFTAEEGRRFIKDTVIGSINDARDSDTGPTAFHVFTDGAGNELSFFAEAGFDYSTALAWLTHPGNQAFLSGIPRYVASLTIKSNVDGNRQIRLNEEDPPRAVVISDGSESLEEDLEWGLVVGMGLLPPTHNGPTPEPFHVFTDGAGNELSFFAEAGFDYSAALTWVNHPMNQDLLLAVSPYVASLTFKLDVEGNRQIRLNEEDPPRAVVISDGSDTLSMDLTWGQVTAQGHIPPTHTTGGATVTDAMI